MKCNLRELTTKTEVKNKKLRIQILEIVEKHCNENNLNHNRYIEGAIIDALIKDGVIEISHP